jgi:hypothetical protein
MKFIIIHFQSELHINLPWFVTGSQCENQLLLVIVIQLLADLPFSCFLYYINYHLYHHLQKTHILNFDFIQFHFRQIDFQPFPAHLHQQFKIIRIFNLCYSWISLGVILVNSYSYQAPPSTLIFIKFNSNDLQVAFLV